MKLLIVGDLHLGKGLSSLAKPTFGIGMNSRLHDQVKLLDWVLETAIDNNIFTIVFTGDIVEDSSPSHNVVNILLQFLKEAEQNNIEIIIVMGNHDFKRTGTYYNTFLDLIDTANLLNVQIHKNMETVLLDGIGLTLMPFRDRRSFDNMTYLEALNKVIEPLEYELGSIPNNYDKILIGHLAITGSIPIGDEIDDMNNELMINSNLFKGYDYVWMGHIHKQQVLNKQNPRVAHIGSLDLSDFGEADHQKIIVIYDSEDPKKFKEIKVPSRPLRWIKISIDKEVADPTIYAINEIKKFHKSKSLNNALVKLEIKLIGEEVKNVDRQVISDFMYQSGMFYLASFLESRTLVAISLDQDKMVENSISPKSAIKLWAEANLTEDDREPYFKLAIEIIDQYLEGIK